ncbi:hypothetical protein PL81_31255 [Streptomyces sp. RSD-27]|nr:hypothetical protein PL81_31255 [Streptomyces sp. RSD-27]
MVKVIAVDLGPHFMGQATQVNGEKICLLPSEAFSDVLVAQRAREFMEGRGRHCAECRGCTIGTTLQ